MRAVCLVERRAIECRLPRADAAVLAADWSHVVEVVPTQRRDRYRLTARGWVGAFDTPHRSWCVVPKLGWAAAGRLLADGRLGEADDLGTGLRSALADRLASLLRERLSGGLVRGYADQPENSAIVRGRINFAARQPAVGFAQVIHEFTTDQPWNGWPLAIAGRLLDGPLGLASRNQLTAVTNSFAGIRPHLLPPTTAQLADRRLAGYRPLLTWCDLVDRAVSGGGLLLNLERLFEAYITERLSIPHQRRTVTAQHDLLLRDRDGRPGLELRPDLVVYAATGRPASAWDVKWKPLPATGPRPDDLHQALGYAAALGVRAAGLLYPGRRFTHRRYDTPGGVTVTVATCRLTGTDTQVGRADAALRRLVFGA